MKAKYYTLKRQHISALTTKAEDYTFKRQHIATTTTRAKIILSNAAHSCPDDKGKTLHSQTPAHNHPHDRHQITLKRLYIPNLVIEAEDYLLYTFARWRTATSQKTLMVEYARLPSQYRASGSNKGSNEAEVPPMTIVA
jgi:hypothetical protein